MRNLLGDSCLLAATSASGGDNTGEVKSLTLLGDNPRSDLNWLYLAMVLLKAYFYGRGFSPGFKPMIYDRVTMTFVHCFLLEGVAIGEARLLGCLGGVYTATTSNRSL
jgi:hypothetical protein